MGHTVGSVKEKGSCSSFGGMLTCSEVKKKRIVCTVCEGNRIIECAKRRNVFNKPGVIMPERRFRCTNP